MPTDRPAYDGAAYAVDRARRHARLAEWKRVAHHASEALDDVQTAPYPHLTERLHRQATDVVLSTKRSTPDAERIQRRLRGMAATVSEMHVLAVRGTTMLPDGFDVRTGTEGDGDPRE
ncbi:hypothetical protein [Halomarina litorea]|uniref:hypothetical protein n=1 Tax=Halomarina litorea TaxID=2961595 RepID=UPI0020C493ED|nr:hypothetical protein [Halomarina sp. BCD28]